MTKEESRDLVQQLIDDPSGARWAPGRLDLLIQMTVDSLWVEIFRIVPEYLSYKQTLTTLTSPGYVDLSSDGDLTYRFYKLMKVTRSGYEYAPIDHRLIVLEDDEVKVGYNRTYTRMGSKLYLFPLELTPEVEVTYTYRPAAFTLLDDGADVEWPDGHEAVYIYMAAAAALGKGAAEDPTMFKEMAEEARRRMVAELERYYPGPTTPFPSGSALAFGSE